MIYKVKTPADLPTSAQYVIINMMTEQITTPGDERSQTDPGHGYPESTETFNNYEITAANTIEEVKALLAKLRERRDGLAKVLVLDVKRLQIKERVEIDFSFE